MIGYMGSGKTSLGKELAKVLGFRFADMDKLIEEGCGKTIPEIFASEGEPYFRKCERSLLEGFGGLDGDMVIATGGGVPCFGDNMDLLNELGVTVYLKMSPEKLVGRLGYGRGKRPIIKDMDDGQLLRFIGEKLPEREKYYSRAAVIADCDGCSDAEVVKYIAEIIGGIKTKQL